MGVCTGTACDFGRDYEIAHAPAMLEIERLVRGSDYGATSWTTCAQELRAARHLQLAPGLRLLEIDAGARWPGLLLAAVGGCDVVLTDLPRSGLRAARKPAVCDGLAERCTLVAADGAAMPLPAALFDRVHHAKLGWPQPIARGSDTRRGVYSARPGFTSPCRTL